jgi:hypothetical protein
MVARQKSTDPIVLAEKSRVFDVAFPHVYGTVTKLGKSVSEIRWDQTTPWGKNSNTINQNLRLIKGDELDVPEFLKVKNRKPLTKELKAKLAKGNQQQAVDEKRDFSLPRSIEPAGLAILEAGKREKEEKKAERLAELKASHQKKEQAPKGPGVISTMIAVISRKEGASLEELFTILKSKFPEKQETSLANTIKLHAKKNATEIKTDKKRGKVFYKK